MSNENQEHKIPAWLQKIQDNSSELELLISGGAIYGLTQASNAAQKYFTEVVFITSKSRDFGVIYIFFQVLLSILIIGFISHLIIRAYWLSLVCLNYVFPEGINYERIKWKKPYSINKNERNDLYNEIVKADKICGLIMFTCISASIIIVGITIFLALYTILTVYILQGNIIIIKTIGSLIGYAFLVYILDLFLSGLFRKTPYISYITYPFFKILDILTLRFLVQKSLWKLNSNSSFVKRTIITIVFIIISIIYTGEQSFFNGTTILDDRKSLWINYNKNIKDVKSYRDDTYNGFTLPAKYTIQSKVITDNFIRLRIRYLIQDHEYMAKNNVQINDIYEIQVNNEIFNDLIWTRWKKSRLDEGIEFIIPISHCQNGANKLIIRDKANLQHVSESKSDKNEETGGLVQLNLIGHRVDIEIPFWYDKLAANNKSK